MEKLTDTAIGIDVAMSGAIFNAAFTGRVYYVFLNDTIKDEYLVSTTWWTNWLFKAHPGGRRVLSKRGTEIFNMKVQPEMNKHGRL